jgi:hypothetical protein
MKKILPSLFLGLSLTSSPALSQEKNSSIDESTILEDQLAEKTREKYQFPFQSPNKIKRDTVPFSPLKLKPKLSSNENFSSLIGNYYDYCPVEVNKYSKNEGIKHYPLSESKNLLLNPTLFSIERRKYHSENTSLEVGLIDCVSNDEGFLREVIYSYANISMIEDSGFLPAYALHEIDDISPNELVDIYIISNSQRVRRQVTFKLEYLNFFDSFCKPMNLQGSGEIVACYPNTSYKVRKTEDNSALLKKLDKYLDIKYLK